MRQGDFTQVAKYYHNRPAYSAMLLEKLIRCINDSNKPLQSLQIVEVGAGTGKLTKMLANFGLQVVAVEPNDNMREEGIKYTQNTQIQWQKGSGEETGIDSNFADWVLMASSFHWTDHAKSLPEFARILKQGGYFTAIWNPRNIKDDSIFADDALGLIGTDGNVTNNVSGATVSSNAIKTIAQESVAQAKLDFNYVPEEIELHVPSVDEDGDPLKTIANDAYANREDIVKVYIPSTVTTIGQRAFQGCVNLKEIVYEDSKTTTAIRINANAFEGCTALDTVSLYINNIGTSAFKDCTSLESFEIDSKSIGNYAFENCTSLTHVIFTGNGGSSSRGKDMFRGWKNSNLKHYDNKTF